MDILKTFPSDMAIWLYTEPKLCYVDFKVSVKTPGAAERCTDFHSVLSYLTPGLLWRQAVNRLAGDHQVGN